MSRRAESKKALEPSNTEEFKAMIKSEEGKKFALDFVHILSDLMDDMITEERCYLTWGMSKDGTKWNVVFHRNGAEYFANGTDFRSILADVLTL